MFQSFDHEVTTYLLSVKLSILFASQYSSELMHVIQLSELNIVTDWTVARRRRGKLVPTNTHPTIEGCPLLGNTPVNSNDWATIGRLFSMGSAPRSYLEENLRWMYNWATLFLGDINTGSWTPRLRESRIWDSKILSRVPRDSETRMTALARTSSNCKRQTRSLVRESAPHQRTRIRLTAIKVWS
jgi:hypothetical protein